MWLILEVWQSSFSNTHDTHTHPSGQWIKSNHDCTYSHSHDGIDLSVSKYHAICGPEWLDIHDPVWFSDWSGSIIIQNALWCIAQDLVDDKLRLGQVMAWCHQASSHYLTQCWSTLVILRCNMAFIEPMHRNKPILLTYLWFYRDGLVQERYC